MQISEIVNKSGLTKDTIRFYEKKGLITVARSKSEWNNYKDYTDAVLEKLLLIKKAKGFGFSLNEIAELLNMVERNEASCEVLAERVQQKLKEIDEKIKELKDMKQMILQNIGGVQNVCTSKNSTTNCKSFSLDTD